MPNKDLHAINTQCNHPQDKLKHYEKDDKIICLECGKVWPQTKIEPNWPPMCPPMEPIPMPNGPYYVGDPIPPDFVTCNIISYTAGGKVYKSEDKK